MIVRCPNCQTAYRIDRQPATAGERGRCSNCLSLVPLVGLQRSYVVRETSGTAELGAALTRESTGETGVDRQVMPYAAGEAEKPPVASGWSMTCRVTTAEVAEPVAAAAASLRGETAAVPVGAAPMTAAVATAPAPVAGAPAARPPDQPLPSDPPAPAVHLADAPPPPAATGADRPTVAEADDVVEPTATDHEEPAVGTPVARARSKRRRGLVPQLLVATLGASLGAVAGYYAEVFELIEPVVLHPTLEPLPAPLIGGVVGLLLGWVGVRWIAPGR